MLKTEYLEITKEGDCYTDGLFRYWSLNEIAEKGWRLVSQFANKYTFERTIEVREETPPPIVRVVTNDLTDKRLKCPECGATIKEEFAGVADTEYISLTFDWECPKCGKQGFNHYKTLYEFFDQDNFGENEDFEPCEGCCPDCGERLNNNQIGFDFDHVFLYKENTQDRYDCELVDNVYCECQKCGNTWEDCYDIRLKFLAQYVDDEIVLEGDEEEEGDVEVYNTERPELERVPLDEEEEEAILRAKLIEMGWIDEDTDDEEYHKKLEIYKKILEIGE